jgi:DNA-binding XRE family transcriptional regulator
MTATGTQGPLPVLRHLDYGPTATITDVGPAGLQAMMDDGDIADWRHILDAIQRDPFGVVAERVVRLLPHLFTYGTAAAFEGWLRRCREGAPRSVGLVELRVRGGVSQRQMAARMGVSQPQVARIEAAHNPTLRTLARYLTALDIDLVGLLGSDAHGSSIAVRLPTECSRWVRIPT